MLSTLSAASQHQQFPVGSVIQYAPDEQHRPLFATSRLSGHTRNMQTDSRTSFTVLRPGWQVGRGGAGRRFSAPACAAAQTSCTMLVVVHAAGHAPVCQTCASASQTSREAPAALEGCQQGLCTAHTSRAKKSLLVQGMDDARITLIGHVRQVPEDQHKAATAEFLRANPQSFWVCSAPLSGSSSSCRHGLLSLSVPSDCRWSLVTSSPSAWTRCWQFSITVALGVPPRCVIVSILLC